MAVGGSCSETALDAADAQCARTKAATLAAGASGALGPQPSADRCKTGTSRSQVQCAAARSRSTRTTMLRSRPASAVVCQHIGVHPVHRPNHIGRGIGLTRKPDTGVPWHPWQGEEALLVQGHAGDPGFTADECLAHMPNNANAEKDGDSDGIVCIDADSMCQGGPGMVNATPRAASSAWAATPARCS